MHLTRLLLRYPSRYANASDNRKVWEVTYRGRSLRKLRATKRPDVPVGIATARELRERLDREVAVMRCLATPFLTEQQEAPWLEKHGDLLEQAKRDQERAEFTRMPGKEKVVTGRPLYVALRGNVGNGLHRTRHIQSDIGYFLRSNKWE